ncbi:WxL domain-containing protein [Weissella confusa]|uniref:WxL domain-containing protein n=1 Tax=Weissella confusa TaxID=1583 RepID=UPI00223AC312|nr:WxL domain-containing protein [Weissella confusa]MCT0022490.1 WxL domain-containing protein [Weissella confusa]
MKKQFTLFAASTLAAMTFVPMVGFADETTPADNTPKTYQSTGTVTFTAPTTTTKPLNPNDPHPNVPVNPKNPDGKTDPKPGTAGPLSLDFASSLDFGKQEITSETKDYVASAQQLGDSKDKNFVPDYVQLTDNRGTFEGWTLSVTQDKQFQTGSGVVLTGAEVTFDKATHATTNSVNADVINKTKFTLTPGVETKIMSGQKAAEGKTNATSGTHILRFGDQDSLTKTEKNSDGTSRNVTDPAITLNVPGSTDKMGQEYTKNFNWTLSNTPSEDAK